jgi:hypothetical protein
MRSCVATWPWSPNSSVFERETRKRSATVSRNSSSVCLHRDCAGDFGGLFCGSSGAKSVKRI